MWLLGLFLQCSKLAEKDGPIALCCCYCRLGQSLGSGQFGTVYKGVLEYGTMRTEVAVKTLKEESGEEAKVKFLQEAAIMGQFKHHCYWR